MAHSFSRNHLHVIFSIRERRKTIPREWQPRLWAYLAGICQNHQNGPIFKLDSGEPSKGN
jgi:hypothetical protein